MSTNSISIVSIGRNEALNLSNHISALKKLKKTNLECEFIYVDSDSEDDSAAIAKQFFCKVLKISEKYKHLSASLGRRVGTSEAKGTWILYLDADFELQDEFVIFLVNNITKLDENRGYTGFYDYIENGKKLRLNVQGYNEVKLERIRSIGGGLLLPREMILKAGNWSSNLVSNEEVDLQLRLEKLGCHIFSLPVKFIVHNTESPSLLIKIVGNLFPFNSYLGRKFYGPGQVLIHAFLNGYGFRLISKRSEIYGTAFFQLIVLALSLIHQEFFMLIIVPLLIMLPFHGFKRSVAFSLHLTQIILGLGKYISPSSINVEIKRIS